MAEEAPTTALAKRDAALLDVIEAALEPGAKAADLPPNVDADQVTRGIIERIISAKTFEEAFGSQSLPSWADTLEGLGVLVRDVKWNRSTISGGEGAPVYAVVDVERMDNGATQTVTCGGRQVQAQLISMLRNGWTDRPVRIVKKPTGDGNTVLWLEDAKAA